VANVLVAASRRDGPFLQSPLLEFFQAKVKFAKTPRRPLPHAETQPISPNRGLNGRGEPLRIVRAQRELSAIPQRDRDGIPTRDIVKPAVRR
jgi:hypothetical protein